MKPRLLPLWVVLTGLLAFVLVLAAADSARAGTFNPTLEVTVANRSMEYRLRFHGQTETYKSLGEAYITAGEKAGVKT